MARPTDKARTSLPPLADDHFMSILHQALEERSFEGRRETLRGTPNASAPSQLEYLNHCLIQRLGESRHNIDPRGYPIGALCWPVAVDAALLDAAIKRDARKVLADKGLAVEQVDAARFYRPQDFCDDVSRDVFCEYVRHRWPIITFSLDPVTDQQNIADSFNLKRDLQLALSFAFATGQINFNQLNTFRRQIQQSSDTIALNRTITGFMEGNDTFGFRFTPRFQNPPNQKTNMGVITSQLISGGPPPNYQIRKSKLEPGIRELNAVLLIPTFLPVMRMNVSSNWFKLTDPEHLVHHTGKMMERGRKVQELRDAVQVLCNAHQYRDADLRVLKSKMAQLDTMLPMQSQVVQLPFENSAAGFDLFLEGSAALVPELTGFSGADAITLPPPPAASTTGGWQHADRRDRHRRDRHRRQYGHDDQHEPRRHVQHPDPRHPRRTVGDDDLHDHGRVHGDRRRLRVRQVHQLAGYACHRRRPRGLVRDPQPRGDPRPDPAQCDSDDDRRQQDVHRGLRRDPQRHQQQPADPLRGNAAYANEPDEGGL